MRNGAAALVKRWSISSEETLQKADRLPYVFLPEGETEQARFTCVEADLQAPGIGAWPEFRPGAWRPRAAVESFEAGIRQPSATPSIVAFYPKQPRSCMANAVELRGIHKAFSQFIAVDHLFLNIHEGSVYGLLGPNGAGKTSSIRMMIGITMPDEGEVWLFGEKFHREQLQRVGYLPEERGLYKRMKVLDHLT